MAVLNTVWSTNPTLASTPTAAQLAAGTTAAAFASWLPAVQLSFLKANGAGNPPQLVLGSGTGQTLFTLVGSDQIQAEALPPAFSDAPSQIDYGTFAFWSDNIKMAYLKVQAAAANEDPHVTFGSGSNAFRSSLSQKNMDALTAGSTIQTSDIFVDTLRADSTFKASALPLTAAAVFGLPASDLKALLQNKGPKDPLQLQGATPIDPVVPIYEGKDRVGYVRLPSGAYPGFFTALTQPSPGAYLSAVDPATFQSWPPVVQAAYFHYQLSGHHDGNIDAAALDTGNGKVAPITFEALSSGGSVSACSTISINVDTGSLSYGATSASAATFVSSLSSSNPLPDFTTFLSWSTEQRQAFVLARTSTGSPVTLNDAQSAGSLLVSRHAEVATGLDLSGDLWGSNLSDADKAKLFGFVDSALQYEYSDQKNTTVLPNGRLGSIAGSGSDEMVLITSNSPRQTVTSYAVPAGFTARPGSLNSATFLTWPSDLQAYYVAFNARSGSANSMAPKGQVTFADGATYGLGNDGVVGKYLPALTDFTSRAAALGYAPPYNVLATATNAAEANTLFFGVGQSPWKDYSTVPTVTQFSAWTAAQRAAYIMQALKYNTAHTTTSNLLPTTYVTLGADSSSAAADVFLSQTLVAGGIPKIYVVQSMQKADIMAMSYKDQVTLVGIPAFKAVAGNLTLIPADGSQANAAATVVGLLNNARSMFMGGSLPTVAQAVFTSEIDLMAAQLFGTAVPDPSAMAPMNGTATIAVPNPQKSGSAVFSTMDITNAINAIEDRYKRANAFASVVCNTSYYSLGRQTATDNNNSYFSGNSYNQNKINGDENDQNDTFFYLDGQTSEGNDNLIALTSSQIAALSGPGVTFRGSWGQIINGTYLSSGSTFQSETDPLFGTPPLTVYVKNDDYTVTLTQPTMLDKNAGALNGYVAFMTQEKTVLANRVAAAKLANTGVITDPTTHLSKALDLPSLLCLFMQFNSNAQQALTSADSEEVNQANALLQDYAAMQSIINTTNSQANNNAQAQLYPEIGSQDANAVNMFGQGGGGGQKYNESPIELYYFNNYSRPTFPNYYNASGGSYWQTTGTWTEQGQQLSDAVTQINQQTQIKMNNITNETKQQDRYFDLASTCLSKLNETLSQIASAV